MRTIPFAVLLLISCSVTSTVLAEDDWWEYGHFYQIYPRSFQDSDGDGIGDLRLERNYITTSISQINQCDWSLVVTNFRITDGRLWNALLVRSWFKKATNPNDPEHEKYRDYFIWHEGKKLENGTIVPPSNWLSIFRYSAWQWVDSVQAYYLHQFLEVQPDLNFRNQAVVDEMKDVLRFWLRKGVSGFRIDAVPFIFETKLNAEGYYDDEPLSGICQDDPLSSCYLNHTQTKDVDETYDMIYQWRRVIDEEEFKDYTKILMTEGYTSLPNVMRYYGKIENGSIVEGQYGAQIPFNFLLLENTWMGTGTWGYLFKMQDFLNNMPKGHKIQANWVLGNHDNKRIASKYKPSRIDLFNIMIKTLPGITITYYGEEIGMTNVWISWEETVDPQACRTDRKRYENASRDPVRTPFQWDSSKNSGFSTAAKTWLPMALNYTECNVEKQLNEKRSYLKVFSDLMALRENPTMKYGAIDLKPIDEEVLVYKRQLLDDPNTDIIIVVLNLEPHTRNINLNDLFKGLPEKMTTVVASVHSSIVPGDEIQTKNVTISPDVGIVFLGKTNYSM